MGGIDANKTVEEVVFGSVLSTPQPQPQQSSCPGPSRGGRSCTPGAGPRSTCAPRSSSQPPRGRSASRKSPGASTSSPRLQSTSPIRTREEQLKQRIEEVENQIARVNLALQNQGIETEMSEESQLRFMSFLQRRLRDLESMVGLVEDSTGAGGYSTEEESVERGRHASRTRSAYRRVGDDDGKDDEDDGRHESIRSVMFELQDLIHNRDQEDDLELP